MIQEPMPVTEDLLRSGDICRTSSQHTIDEERLEQMSHPKKVMERMIPPTRWNGLAWFRTKGHGKVLLDFVESCHQCASNVDHSVPPNITRSTRQAFSVRVAEVTFHFHFFPRQGQAMENACESAQTDTAQATIQEAPKSRCFAQDTWSSRTRGYIRDGYRRP